ncbi:putative transcription factor and/or regulators TTF-type(Zn) family [Helianthus debilis subsp. tardiflorus]
MWKYPVNIREQVRLAYISLGVYQIKLQEYKPRGPKNNRRRFKYAWFDMFPNWLEYSPTKHKAYCFLCYLYNEKPNECHGHGAFTSEGFDNWKKVNDGDKCPLLKHMKSSNHKNAFLFYKNLLNQ